MIVSSKQSGWGRRAAARVMAFAAVVLAIAAFAGCAKRNRMVDPNLAMPLGLDMVIGSVRRKYSKLEPDHPAMQCLEDCIKQSGFESIMRVRDFYS